MVILLLLWGGGAPNEMVTFWLGAWRGGILIYDVDCALVVIEDWLASAVTGCPCITKVDWLALPGSAKNLNKRKRLEISRIRASFTACSPS